MDLIDLSLRYLNQIIIMVYEAQVRWHQYIYIGLDDFKTLALSLSYMYIYKQETSPLLAVHTVEFIFLLQGCV